MGQYHIPVNLTKREFIMPHMLGNGLKLYEQSGEASVATAVMMLLNASVDRGGGDFHRNENTEQILGRWVGDVVMWVGDYSEFDDAPPEYNLDLVYSMCRDPRDDPDEEREWLEQQVDQIAAAYGAQSRRAIDAQNRLDRYLEEEKKGPFTDISLLVGAAMEDAFGFRFVGDGWRKRLSDEAGHQRIYVVTPLKETAVAFTFPGALRDYAAGTKYVEMDLVNFDEWCAAKDAKTKLQINPPKPRIN